MSNCYFQFQQFTVWHDRCAMKVGTDGTLLGAWAPLQGVRRVLDVGTGTGLIALICAQRQPDAYIRAIDIDEGAVNQARFNVQASPFASRIEVSLADILQWDNPEKYDLIVCNPPFFQDALTCPDAARTLARHNQRMPFEGLCRQAARMLTPQGHLAVVLPKDMQSYFLSIAAAEGLYLHGLTEVCTKEGKPAKRVLLSLGPDASVPMACNCLCMMDAQGQPTTAYRQLTDAFYLKK